MRSRVSPAISTCLHPKLCLGASCPVSKPQQEPAMSFWLFIAVVVVAGIANGAFQHYQTQQTIRKAIEKGQTLDAETLERLLQTASPKGPPPRAGLIVGGVVMLAVGAGLALIGWFMSHTRPDDLWQGLGVGSLVALIGAGLLVAAWLIGRLGKVEE
jgi:hypothetical protein